MDSRIAALLLATLLPAAFLAGCAEASPVAPAHPIGTGTAAGKVSWACDFEGTYCGMQEQSKIEPAHRSTFVSTARHGRQAVKLTTLPGDDRVHGSGAWVRDDLELAPSPEYCNEGQEEWWGVSVLFPEDYVAPEGGGAVMDFHHDGSAGEANFNLISRSGGLLLHGFSGDPKRADEYGARLGRIRRDAWYDFVFHVKWSSGGGGFMVAWVNGRKVLVHHGPTLYRGTSCYLKLANYHDPTGSPSSIVFDRLVRGTGAGAVALTTLAD